MGFTSAVATAFQIRRPRAHWTRNEELREVIPADYAVVLGTDRAKSNDATELAGVKQQKCVAHLQRSLNQVLHLKHGRGCSFTNQCKALLTEATERWRRQRAGLVPDWDPQVADLDRRLTHHLRDRRLPDPDNQRLLYQLGWHHDRGSLLRFLQQPEVPPDNNAAERAPRPAVIAHKISHCSKEDRSAETFTRFVSLGYTLGQRGYSSVDGLETLFRTGFIADFVLLLAR